MPAIKIEGYERVAVTGSDGKKKYTRDKGDAVAVALRGLTLEEVEAVMSENGLGDDFNSLIAERPQEDGSVKTLNNGQVRMLCGQKLRSKMRTDGSIVVGGETVASDLPPLEKKEKKEKKAKNTEENVAA